MLWEDLGNIYFDVTVLSARNNPSDVAGICNMVCLSVNDAKIITCFWWRCGLHIR